MSRFSFAANDFAPTPPTLPGPRWQRIGLIGLVLGLYLLHAALYPLATLVTDSGRDFANAWAVGHGGPYPAYGPALFGTWKLGPMWFWLLALPLRLFGSITAAAIFIGLLAAAKIPLAWVIGRRLVDTRMGLIAALLMAVPGWDSVSTLVLGHVNVVQSAMLACLWLALRAWQSHRASLLVLACLMLALALHAHPTAVLIAPALLPPLWRCVLKPREWVWLLLCLLAFALPFAPALLQEARSGWPQLSATAGYLDQSDPIRRLARLPQLLSALLAGGAWFNAQFLLPSALRGLWPWLHGLLLVSAAPGLVRLLLWRRGLPDVAPARGTVVLVLLSSLAALVFIALLRDVTPVWMVYALAPFGVACLSLGLWGLLAGPRHAGMASTALIALMLLVLALDALLLQQRIGLQNRGRIELPGAHISDIARARDAAATHFSPWLAAWQFDALAHTLCQAPQRTAVHADLALLLDFSQGVASRLHCPRARLPRLGGIAAQRHHAGLPRDLAAQLGYRDAAYLGHVWLQPVQALAPAQGREAEVDVRYRVERQTKLDAAGVKTRHGQLQCEPGQYLVVSNLMPLLNALEVRVQQHGDDLSALASSMSSHYYRCDGGLLHWRIESPDPRAIDIVLLPAPRP